MNRKDIVEMLNNSGLASTMREFQLALLKKATTTLLGNTSAEDQDQASDYQKRKNFDNYLLNSVGPAAAYSAVNYAMAKCKDSISHLSLNGSITNNLKLIQNDDGGGFDNFSNTMRQFLLPRYAYLNFDNIIDPRHQIDNECGYPRFITPIMYRYIYDRDDVARRVNDIYPDESWAADPIVYEDEDEETDTKMESEWKDICEELGLLRMLYRADKLCGVGHYGVMLYGFDDGKDLSEPVDEPELLAGVKNSIGKIQRKVLYVRPFDEYLSFIHQYETDVSSPRYGLPLYYNLVFLDMTIDAAGASVGTRLNRRVHWTRVQHLADNLSGSLVFGVPRMQPVFNRLLDLRKIKGGSAEMFWKGAFPGINFEIDPRFIADDPDFDKDKFKDEVESYSNGLQRYLTTLGVKANSLAPQVADPSKHVTVQMQAIAAHYGVPIRVFLGSEEGRLASSQDKLTWNGRLKRRLRTFVEPEIIRAVVSRLIACGCLTPPKVKDSKYRFLVDWGDLNTSTDEDKSNLALKWTQALSQYVASGVIHLIQPLDYLTLILGLPPAQAKRILAAVDVAGLAKLKKVDPSQGAGVNGKAKNNVTKGEKSGTVGSRPQKRDRNQKKVEGSTS